MPVNDNAKASEIALELTKLAVESGKFLREGKGQPAELVSTVHDMLKVYDACFKAAKDGAITDPGAP